MAPNPTMNDLEAGHAGPVRGPGTTATRPNTRHIPALDGMRGLAILLVLLLHCTEDITSRSPSARMLVGLASIGWCGVNLFFVLSGFLITGILFDTKDTSHRYRNFYARRAS